MSLFITYEDISNEGQPPLFKIYRRNESTTYYYVINHCVFSEQALMIPTLSDRYVMEWDHDAKAWWVIDAWFDVFKHIGDFDEIKELCTEANYNHAS